MDTGKHSRKERKAETHSGMGVSGGDVCNWWSEILKEGVREGFLAEEGVDLALEGRRPPLLMTVGLTRGRKSRKF